MKQGGGCEMGVSSYRDGFWGFGVWGLGFGSMGTESNELVPFSSCCCVEKYRK